MATNYGGYMGKVMLIDLSTGQTQEYPWSDRERRLFLGLRADGGGFGLGVGKDARGDFFNSVHCFTLVCGVTC